MPTTREVLQTARQAEEDKRIKRSHRQRGKRLIMPMIVEEEEGIVESDSSGSDSDCVVVAYSKRL